MSGDEEALVILGTCTTMCPIDEVKLRTREKLLHPLERVEGVQLVKEYSRSAAAKTTPRPDQLRPLAVLVTTTDYLLDLVDNAQITLRPVQVYEFVFDRLRAVRQDLVIQRTVPSIGLCTILEKTCLYLLLASYRFRHEPGSYCYDSKINATHLRECLRWLLSCYDEIDAMETARIRRDGVAKTNTVDANDSTIKNERTLNSDVGVKSLHGNYYDRKVYHVRNRAQFECLHLLYHVNAWQNLDRYHNLDKDLRTNVRLQRAYRIVCAFRDGNFVRFCRLVAQCSVSDVLALHGHLHSIHRRALNALTHGYNSKVQKFPLHVLSRLVDLPECEARRLCESFGQSVREGEISFRTATLLKPDKLSYSPEPQRVRTRLAEISTEQLIHDR